MNDIHPYRTAGRQISELELKAIRLEKRAQELAAKMAKQHRKRKIEPTLAKEVERLLHEAGYNTIYKCHLYEYKSYYRDGSNPFVYDDERYACLTRGNTLWVTCFGTRYPSEDQYIAKPDLIPAGKNLITKIKALKRNPLRTFNNLILLGPAFYKRKDIFCEVTQMNDIRYSRGYDSLIDAVKLCR